MLSVIKNKLEDFQEKLETLKQDPKTLRAQNAAKSGAQVSLGVGRLVTGLVLVLSLVLFHPLLADWNVFQIISAKLPGLGLMGGLNFVILVLVCSAWALFVLGPWQIRNIISPEPFLLVFWLFLLGSYFGSSEGLVYSPHLNLLPVILGLGLMVTAWGLKRKFSGSAFVLLLFSQVLISLCFLFEADGRLLFSDDHPSFLYRLELLKEHFPRIPFYNPEWNAGYSAREFLASGMLNIWLIVGPVIKFLGDVPVSSYYNYLILFLYVFLVPWAVVLSGRLVGLNPRASAWAGVLALAPSLSWFEWLLTFGTLGFALSAGLLPLCMALICRFAFVYRDSEDAESDSGAWVALICLLPVSFLVISWSLAGLILLPAVFLAVYRFFSKGPVFKVWQSLFFSAAFLIVNLPWMNVFFEESKVFSFIQGSNMPGLEAGEMHGEVSDSGSKVKAADVASKPERIGSEKKTDGLVVAKDKLWKEVKRLNPVLSLLVIPGLIFIKHSWVRVYLSLTLVWTIALLLLGESFKPQLELKRMLIPAAFIACLPVGQFLDSLASSLNLKKLTSSDRALSRYSAVFLSFLLLVPVNGFLFFSPVAAANIFSNRAEKRFVFEPREFAGLSAAINDLPGDGRVLFSGFVLHELGASSLKNQDGGHIAPIAVLANKSLYSSDFYHTKWSKVDPIPEAFRKRGASGIERFLELLNVSAVATARPEWVDYFSSKPWYQKKYQGKHFFLFARTQNEPGYFLKGSGRVETRSDGLLVWPEEEVSILRFRFLPKLKARLGDERPSFLDWLRGVGQRTDIAVEPVRAFKREVGANRREDFFFIKLKVSKTVLNSGKPVQLSY